MSYKFAVSKATKNVLTATDPNDFIFHSNYNTFKILATGNGTISVAAGAIWSNVETITHNYGTRQGFFIFFKYPNGRVASFHNPIRIGTSDGTLELIDIVPPRNSANSILFNVANWSGSAVDIEYKYYLFEIAI